MKKINKIIVIIFVFFAIIIGSHHEPWADEAQSWLIARDSSVKEIVWDISRYEGTFPLWFLTLKIFITFGLEYELLYIVPIIISVLGLILFLKKVEAPKFIKILLPFTYYIFYQYTIVARSYCYLFLAFSLWGITYKNRLEKPLKYLLSLIFLSLISMHGMVIAYTFGFLFLLEVVKTKQLKKNLISFAIFATAVLIEIIILFPRNDLLLSVLAVFSIKDIIVTIINTLIGNGTIFFRIYNIISILLLTILLINHLFIKNKDSLIVTIALIVFMVMIRVVEHHLGIIYILIMFGIICNYEQLKEKNKYLDKILISVMIIYNVCSISSGINDYTYQYSGAKEMTAYIKEMNYENEEIYAFGYKPVALLPYFENNLYKNREYTFYRWSSKNIDFYNYTNFKTIDKTQFKDVPQYILLEYNLADSKLRSAIEMIENTGLYEIYHKTTGMLFFKNSYSEGECFILYKLN